MGGALSIIFAQACAVSQPQLAERIAGVYTYGCPRCGDIAFAEVPPCSADVVTLSEH